MAEGPRAFTLWHQAADSQARTGLVETPHGRIPTPMFMPVGTAATVKSLTMEHLREIGARIILGNTYHLYLRPGTEVISAFGGLHGFQGWDRQLLTDSGGFQIFSLRDKFKVGDEGVRFQSHIDGSRHELGPEKAVDIQLALNSDIQMVLDQFAPHPASRASDEEACRRTTLWATRARRHFLEHRRGQWQFCIVQGGLWADLRQKSLDELLPLAFDGYAVGGLSVGEPQADFERITGLMGPRLPADKPRYLMGSGTPEEILHAVGAGFDLFDCVLPSRNARRGTLFTSEGKLQIRNERYRNDPRPLDPDCGCPTCTRYSRAYLRHLFLAREMSAATLLTLHNLQFYLDFMARIRYFIELDRFQEFRQGFIARYRQGVSP